MKNTKRIKRILTKGESIWKQYPDLRFYQLVSDILSDKLDNKYSHYYTEDDVFENQLNEFIERNNVVSKRR